MVSGRIIFQQIVCIFISTNFTPLFLYILLYSYETEFIQTLLSTDRHHHTYHFNFTYRYINEELSIKYVKIKAHLNEIPVRLNGLEIKEKTESNKTTAWRFKLHISYLRRFYFSIHTVRQVMFEIQVVLPDDKLYIMSYVYASPETVA